MIPQRIRRIAGLIAVLAVAATACAQLASGARFSLDTTVDALIGLGQEQYAAASELVEASKPETLDEGSVALSATSRGNVVRAHAGPSATSELVAEFAPVNYFGYDPTTFAIFEETLDDQGNAWYRAQLPPNGLEAFPNGTEAWIPADGLDVSKHSKKLVINLTEHTLRLYENGAELQHWLVGIGKAGTRTPTGNFFMWTKWLPEQGSHPAYGAAALAISAQSDDLPSWQGGAPLIAMHGTSRTSDLGSDVSHGCVRIHNDDLRALIDQLPLGTPVEIVA